MEDGLQAAIVEQAAAQAACFLQELGRSQGLDLDTLYVGGGTPSALPGGVLDSLLGRLRLAHWREWTVEANPESLDSAFLDSCRTVGVTRLSVGIQSMSEPDLRMLGRPGTLADNERALGLLRGEWSGDLNLDFIAGIPGQAVVDVLRDLASLREAGAQHASLYSLTVEPGTELAALVNRGRFRLNDPGLDEDLWFAGRAELSRLGFSSYEISNFCRPGKASLHNLRYWRLEPYLGVGPGAVSTLPAGAVRSLLARHGRLLPADAVVCRLSCPESLEGFLRGRESLWGIEVEVVPAREFLLESLMMGLRLADGIPARAFERRFGKDFDEVFPGLWAGWVEHGLAAPRDEGLRLSEQGRLVLDSLLEQIAERTASEDLPPLVLAWP